MTTIEVGDTVESGFGDRRKVIAVHGTRLWVVDAKKADGEAFTVEARFQTKVLPDKIFVREIVSDDYAVFTREFSMYNMKVKKTYGYLHVNVTQGTAVVKDHA